MMNEPVKRRAGRPPQHVGLATPMNLKKVANGLELQNLRGEEPKQEGPVLPATRASYPKAVRGSGIFGAASHNDPERPAKTLSPPVLDNSGGSAEDESLSFTAYLKKVAMEIAPEDYQDADSEMTGLELLARKVFYAALSDNMGAQRARELVVERLEGKAVRAAQVQTPDTTIEDQIDRAAVAALNELATSTKDDNGVS